jgi:hypothetical protein
LQVEGSKRKGKRDAQRLRAGLDKAQDLFIKIESKESGKKIESLENDTDMHRSSGHTRREIHLEKHRVA